MVDESSGTVKRKPGRPKGSSYLPRIEALEKDNVELRTRLKALEGFVTRMFPVGGKVSFNPTNP